MGEILRKFTLFIWITVSFLGFSFLTTIKIPFSVDDGAIYDSRGFIYAFSGKSMMILDVSNPSRVDLRTFSLKKFYDAGAVCGDKLYISAERSLFVYDVSNPFHPKLLKELEMKEKIEVLACAKGVVYAMGVDHIYVLRESEVIGKVRYYENVTNNWWVNGNYLFVQRYG